MCSSLPNRGTNCEVLATVKFRARLTWFGVMVAALTMLVFGILLHALVSRTGPETQDRDLAALAARTVSSLATAPAATFSGPVLPPVPVDVAAGTEPFIEVIAADGSILFSTGQVAGAPPVLDQALIDQARREGIVAATIIPAPGVELRVAVRPFSRPDLDLTGVVVAGQSAGLTAANLRGLSAVLLVAAIVTILAAWLVSRLVASRALQPLRQLAATADRIATTGDFDQRLPATEAQDEVGALTSSFNRMLDRLSESRRRLADSLEQQRRFVADASHELRSPLAVIRSNLSFLERQPGADPADRESAAADSARAAVAMTNLIDDLLRLARLDADQPDRQARVSIAEAVKQAADRSAAGADLVVGPIPEVVVHGDLEDLTRLLVNLIVNARTHGRPPIEIEVDDTGAEVVLEVRDHGPGLPPGQEERIFDRFYRIDQARSGGGTGLGLAIARGLAEQHGGTLIASNRPTGGAVFTLHLPK